LLFNLFADCGGVFGRMVADHACAKDYTGKKAGRSDHRCQTSGYSVRAAHGDH
jgi:hypothetical protein